MVYIIWAENLSSGDCEQQRCRPACTSAQTRQHLYYSLNRLYHIWTCYKGNFNFLASHCSLGDWFETRFVGNPEDRFSRDEAHLVMLCHEVHNNVAYIIIIINS